MPRYPNGRASVAPPFREATVRVRFGRGFDQFWTAIQVLLADKKVIYGAQRYYFHNTLDAVPADWMDRATLHYKEQMAVRYAELVYDGMWFSPLREALDAFVNQTQQTVTGVVRVKLYKGNIMSAGVKSPYSLYHEGFVTFGEDEVYDQKDADGFINLFGLPLKIRALMMQREAKQK